MNVLAEKAAAAAEVMRGRRSLGRHGAKAAAALRLRWGRPSVEAHL
jgi:hypothetical protein